MAWVIKFFLQRIQNVKKKEKIYFLFSVLRRGAGDKCFFLQRIEIYTFFGGGWNRRGSVARISVARVDVNSFYK